MILAGLGGRPETQTLTQLAMGRPGVRLEVDAGVQQQAVLTASTGQHCDTVLPGRHSALHKSQAAESANRGWVKEGGLREDHSREQEYAQSAWV